MNHQRSNARCALTFTEGNQVSNSNRGLLLSSSKHFRSWLIFVLTLANIVVIALSGYWLEQSRLQHELRARTLTQSTVTALDKNVSGNIKAIDLALRAVADELMRLLSQKRVLDEYAATAFLLKYERRLPEIGIIRVADKNGVVIAGQGVEKSGRASWSDRDFFTHFRENCDDSLRISKPLIGRVIKQYIISFSRCYSNPDGSFAGVISAAIPLSHFTELLSQYDLGHRGTLILRDFDLGLITRYPMIPDQQAGKVGDAGVSKAFRELVASGVRTSTYYISNSPDGFERILTFHRLEKVPMYAIVGTASDDYLADWNKERFKTWSLVAGFLLFSVIVGIFLVRLSRLESENAAQLNAIFDLSPDGFISFDNRHCVKYVSPAFLRLTGLNAAEVIGLSEAAFSANLAALCLPFSQFRGIASLQSQVNMNSSEPSLRDLIELSSPRNRVLEVVLRLSLAENVSKILYFRDVTHETEIDRMKSEFLSIAAHELRTPMASIFGFSELLLAQEFDEQTRRDLISTIYRQAALMASIINELLDLARIEERRGKDFVFETLNLAEVVDQAISGYKPEEGRDPIYKIASDSVAYVSADNKKLQQVITNLISNAYKYSPGGGEVSLYYRMEKLTGRSMVGIEVKDHGIGMTKEQQARVFERFYRADTSGKIPGTGLGMSIVKEIVDIHHGEIAIQSVPGQGTTVTVWLPVLEVATPQLAIE